MTIMMKQNKFGALLDHVLERAIATTPSKGSREWTEGEDAFVCKNLGWLTDAEMGEALGRSDIAVHLRWSRDLHLPGPSKAPDVVTAHQAAKMLGIDAHKTAHWVDKGLIPGRLMAGGRNIRLIQRLSFMVWACSPKNWVYFDIKGVTDPKLKRLLKLRAKRWGDAWWSTKQVAQYHGVETGDVKRYIVLGRLHSFRLPLSLGGRHGLRKWSNHYVLKSEAVQVKFYRGRGSTTKGKIFTPRADVWLLKARDQLGMTFVAIGKTMKIGKQKISKNGHGGTNSTIAYRYHTLQAMKKQKRSKSHVKN